MLACLQQSVREVCSTGRGVESPSLPEKQRRDVGWRAGRLARDQRKPGKNQPADRRLKPQNPPLDAGKSLRIGVYQPTFLASVLL